MLSLLLSLQQIILSYTKDTTIEQVAADMKNNPTTAVGAIEEFNETLIKGLLYAGCIIIAIAVVKLVISMQQQDSNAKMQAAMMFGLGAAFVSSGTIVSYLKIKDSTADQVVLNMVDIIGTVMKAVAIILLVFAVFQMITSFINEDAMQKYEAGKLMAIGGVLYGIRSVLSGIASYALAGSMAGVTVYIIDIVADVARFTGVILGIYGLFQLIMAMKEQDSTPIQKGITMVTVGIILAMMPLVFRMFGLTGTVPEYLESETTITATPTPTSKPPKKPTTKFDEWFYIDQY